MHTVTWGDDFRAVLAHFLGSVMGLEGGEEATEKFILFLGCTTSQLTEREAAGRVRK